MQQRGLLSINQERHLHLNYNGPAGHRVVYIPLYFASTPLLGIVLQPTEHLNGVGLGAKEPDLQHDTEKRGQFRRFRVSGQQQRDIRLLVTFSSRTT
jgi:hypothetical protein